MMTEELNKYGVDTQDALSRCMENKELLEKLYRMFPETVTESGLSEKLEAGDTESALKSAHMLKGMTANLSMTDLYRGYSEIVELLRFGDHKKACQLYHQLEKTQNNIISIINTYK